jgi:hypothetical protein
VTIQYLQFGGASIGSLNVTGFPNPICALPTFGLSYLKHEDVEFDACYECEKGIERWEITKPYVIVTYRYNLHYLN